MTKVLGDAVGSTRLLTMFAIGAVMGAGMALLAGSLVAERAGTDARRLDDLATVSEMSSLLRSATNQALIVSVASPEGDSRAGRLAVEEAELVLQRFQDHVEPLTIGDTVLEGSAERLTTAASRLLTDLEESEEQVSASAMDLAHRNLNDVLNDRREAARESAMLAAAGGGTFVVGATTLVFLLLPLAAVVLVARRSPQHAVPSPGTDPVPLIPARLATEFEDGATAVLSHARYLANARPREASAYRSMLAEAHRLASVMRNLLSWERSRAGELVITTEPTELSPVVERIAAEASDLGVIMETVTDDVVVMGDPVRIHQVIENLVSVLSAHGGTRIGLVVSRDRRTGSVCVASEDAHVPRDVLRALQSVPVDPSRATALSLTVAHDLTAAMEGGMAHTVVDGATVFTARFSLANGRQS